MGRGSPRRGRRDRAITPRPASVAPGEVILAIANAQDAPCPRVDAGAHDFVSYFGFSDGPQLIFVQPKGEPHAWLYVGL